MQKKAIVLFSGGLDSTTCLALAKSQGFFCYALTFSYGQKHKAEIRQARKIAKQYKVIEHKVLDLPLDEIGGSSLVDVDIKVPDYNGMPDIPNTYVPARNTIFLSFALAWAEVTEAYDIFIGANCIDYSHYPDCRPNYLNAFVALAQLATKVGVEEKSPFKIHAPLLSLNKAQIILEGQRLGIDHSQTISCYRADVKGRSCGCCDSCTYRKKGFKEANLIDPTPYYGSRA
jgi:7-cyano-7-deazaguanine synthase